ncbi:MAG: hypothetical protein HN348_36305, partial [Proteobacteria bacterium]|nr:hypothetical protein [Pseudomonadota bacterium]
DLVVIDPLGLNDYITSRIELDHRGRPGHEKIAPPAWFQVRYPPGKGMIIRQQLGGAISRPPTPEELDAARRTLESPELSALRHAVTAPLTPRLFLANVAAAYRYSTIRIPPDPISAARQFDQ